MIEVQRYNDKVVTFVNNIQPHNDEGRNPGGGCNVTVVHKVKDRTCLVARHISYRC